MLTARWLLCFFLDVACSERMSETAIGEFVVLGENSAHTESL